MLLSVGCFVKTNKLEVPNSIRWKTANSKKEMVFSLMKLVNGSSFRWKISHELVNIH